MMRLVTWTRRLCVLALAVLLLQVSHGHADARADLTNRPNVVILFNDCPHGSHWVFDVGCSFLLD